MRRWFVPGCSFPDARGVHRMPSFWSFAVAPANNAVIHHKHGQASKLLHSHPPSISPPPSRFSSLFLLFSSASWSLHTLLLCLIPVLVALHDLPSRFHAATRSSLSYSCACRHHEIPSSRVAGSYSGGSKSSRLSTRTKSRTSWCSCKSSATMDSPLAFYYFHQYMTAKPSLTRFSFRARHIPMLFRIIQSLSKVPRTFRSLPQNTLLHGVRGPVTGQMPIQRPKPL